MDAPGSGLPAGTVTFVFTDIEGSTRLIRMLGDAYTAVLDRHREILRDAWRRNGGHEVDTEGDSFFVAFANRGAAVVACVEGQRALGTERWSVEAPVRVRMGIHTGVAVPRGRDYVAFAVHQAARVVDTAHGGQIVLSQDAATGIELPLEITLRSLGRYRVRDFDDPLELWQVHAAGLAEIFPALRALPADHHNLATPPTAIIGRDEELAHLADVMRPARAVTVVGTGGVGKTRLAVEHGLRSLAEWPDGVWFVDLAPLDDGALVPAAVAASLGVRTPPESDVVSEVVARLVGKHALLILDNAEHVREAVANLVSSILQRTAGVGILTTSREPLGWRAETVVRLGPLASTPPPGGDPRSQPAVRLFLDRAAEAGAAADQDGSAVAALCDRLDGLPLAIEMVAARAGVLAPREILVGLADAAGSFGSRDPTLAERHRSFDHLLAWSDRLLDESERAALRRLSVFVGSFGYESAAAAAAAGDLDAHMVPDLIWSLANKSLLNADATAGGTRYRFPETVRTYARRHDPDGDVLAAARRLAAWYLDSIGPTCTLDRAWRARMAEDVDNIRGLISLLADADTQTAQCLAWSIVNYQDLSQAFHPAVEEVTRYAEQLAARTPARVALLTRLALARTRVGDVVGAAQALDQARALQAEVGRPPWDEVGIERTEGELAVRAGRPEVAIRLAEEVLGRQLSDRSQGRMWNMLGIARSVIGDATGGVEACRAELAAWQRLGLEALQVSAHGNVAEALLALDDRAGAAHHQRRCLQLALQFGQPLMVAYSLMVAARLAAGDGAWQTAVRLQTAADAQLGEIGMVMYHADREAADDVLAAGAGHLGSAAYEEQRRHGGADDFATFLTLADDVFASLERTEEHA